MIEPDLRLRAVVAAPPETVYEALTGTWWCATSNAPLDLIVLDVRFPTRKLIGSLQRRECHLLLSCPS